MRKLNLKLGSIKEMLSKEQMKNIVGGYMGNKCDIYCCPDHAPFPGGCDLIDSFSIGCEGNCVMYGQLHSGYCATNEVMVGVCKWE